MSEIKSLIDSLRAMELPKGAESLLSSIGSKAGDLERDRDDLRNKVDTRQTENAKLKDRAQTAEQERDEARAKIPADGTVTLSKTDAMRWQAYNGMGTPDEVKAKLDRVDTLEKEKSKTEREATIREAGYDPVGLTAFMGEVLKIVGEGEEARLVASVDDKEVELEEWAEGAGLSRYLAAAKLDGDATPPPPKVPTGAGAKPPKGFTAVPAAERIKEKGNENRYSKM